MPSPARSSAAIALLAALALAAGVGGWTVRARRGAWRARVDRLCACGEPVIDRLRRGADASPDDLGAVMRAQARVLAAGCGDLRRGLRDRSIVDELRGRPVRVAPTVEHDRALDAARSSLRRLCDPERDAAWARDPALDPGGLPWSPELIRAANEARRLRAALCARRAALLGDPEAYLLSAAQADEEARVCGGGSRGAAGRGARR